MDVIPLLTFLGALLLQGLVWFGVVRNQRVLVAGGVLLLVSWLSVLLLRGDPDVWDFYASVWFAPLLVLGVTALWWLWSCSGRRG